MIVEASTSCNCSSCEAEDIDEVQESIILYWSKHSVSICHVKKSHKTSQYQLRRIQIEGIYTWVPAAIYSSSSGGF
ncbi:hypothetical protein TorRG33x02_106330 [Trema orientale]|uniref:Uncharacterized protein n=1 Tax=Trema orientale TaxID=63057 RepID=A0A2P5F7B7_TREOI|nr:hypothetical protein TorRG33x02_106330 [Trema orientale]